MIVHRPDGAFDRARAAGRGEGLAGAGRHGPREGGHHRPDLSPGTRRRGSGARATAGWRAPRHHVVAIDYGIKRNILRLLADHGCRVTVLPATATAEDVLAHKPDGVFLSNGPGDPAATGDYAVPAIRGVIESGMPIFGICLGHQMLGLALGAKTVKMHHGHHGANHPVKDLTTGKVEITSMNHGFAVDSRSLPDGVEETHVSLFDGSNCGLRLTGPAGVLGPVPPRGLARPARLPLPVPALRRHDGGQDRLNRPPPR